MWKILQGFRGPAYDEEKWLVRVGMKRIVDTMEGLLVESGERHTKHSLLAVFASFWIEWRMGNGEGGKKKRKCESKDS